MTLVRWLIIAGCVLGAGVSAGWADEPPAAGQPDRVDEVMGRYNLHPAFVKLGRGLSNAFGGWLEIPLNFHQRYSMSDTAGSLFTGAAYGLFKGLVRTGVGAYETVTFFLPYPEDFAPILPTLPYFQREPKERPLPRASE
ncbi:MAG: exosortase system-associated protein, TIGR04073 family [Candidatus Omnitrophica bacterium]|nr:exosortase system-associated protein, TIGR04073 family [Candidatus Omnitrophota bacterium]